MNAGHNPDMPELDISEPGLPGVDGSGALLFLENLRYRWAGSSKDVLDIGRFSVSRGERVFLQGVSGSGKTTLLNLLGGVITPDSGVVSILDTDLTKLGHAARDTFRADHIGFVFQQFNLIPYLSLIDNVTLPCRFSKTRRNRITAKGTTPADEATRLLSQLGLNEEARSSRSVTALSVGQQQRVAVARAMIGSPELIIADEPTSALDVQARFAFLDLLFHEVEASNATLLFVSHDPALQKRFERSVRMVDINRAGITEEA
ncbi:ABC transporter ATP-binding protein [Hahella ganghwensis]|uniref:ABC transporter ATP-binding protein n=1 Tax=Hahella ganghwensis TaxID=286420 RepID=UPI0003600180|nr:ABC transporter ATP-binding protein [Hahella ganghwensis]